MPTSKLLPQFGIFLEQYSRAGTLQSLHYLTHILRRTVPQKSVNVVSCHLPAYYLALVLRRYAAYYVTHTKRYIPVSTGLRYFGIISRAP
jgi:hypothetical protein